MDKLGRILMWTGCGFGLAGAVSAVVAAWVSSPEEGIAATIFFGVVLFVAGLFAWAPPE